MICPFCKKESMISTVYEAAINGVRPMEYFRCWECDKTWYKNFDLLEALADLEHEQWKEWTEGKWRELHNIKRDLDEAMDVNSAIKQLNSIHERWSKNWKPYAELDEATKEKDRVYARKVIDIFNKRGLLL